jgi:hypothetical protein|tara:strand:- start:574 stop:915 length:342 start_codon:yes stop_codon:yes gene_type:complete
MTRQERLALHKKQERLHVKNGSPTASELIPGVPVLRNVSQKGLVEYVVYNDILHEKKLEKSSDQQPITRLTDSSGGTASNTLAAITGSYVEATIENTVASLAAKINEIIKKIK